MKRELTSQELLERYIHSVKTGLPPDKADDIAAEIASNLQSLVDDQAAEFGRELSPAEVSAILKQHGHPLLVSSRYRDQPGRGLISPTLFPLYWFTLRAIFTGWVAVRIFIAAFSFEGAASAGSILLRLSRDIMLAGFLIAAGVTLLFATWEYLEFRFRYSERWKPESLPAVPPPIRQPKVNPSRPVVHIARGVVWLVFLAMALFVPGLSWVWGGRGVFSLSAVAYAMRLPLWVLAFFAISQSWLRYTRFAEAAWRPYLRIGVAVAGLLLAIALVSAGDLLVPGPKWDPSQAKPLATLNRMISGVLVLSCISWSLQCFRELRSYVTHSPARTPASVS